MQYELARSRENHYFSISPHTNVDFNFPLHFHKSFEVLFVERGEQILSIGGVDFTVCGGEAALILPGQLHSYRTEREAESWICIFSADFLPDLEKYTQRKQKHHPVFSATGFSLARFQEVQQDSFAIKAQLYDIAARYVAGAVFNGFGHPGEPLLYELVQYVNVHFTESLTLGALARRFGYNYRYLSGVINRAFGVSFSKVLRQYRVDLACRLLRESELSVTEMAGRCGFETLRSFNRSFKEETGLTPTEYRRQNVFCSMNNGQF